MEAFSALLAALLAWLTAFGERSPWLATLSAILIVGGEVLWLRQSFIGKTYRIRREVEEKDERLEADLKAFKGEVHVFEHAFPKLPGNAWTGSVWTATKGLPFARCATTWTRKAPG